MMISIDAGSSMIKIVEGEAKKGGVSVKRAVTAPTPPGTIRDGNIIDSSVVSGVIVSALFSNGFSAKKLTFTVNSTEILHRELIVPKGDRKKLAPIVQNEMYQHLTGGEQYAVDFLFNDEPVEDSPLMQKVNASSMQKKMATDYYNLTNLIKLKPGSLQMHTSAVAKLLCNAKINNQAIEDKSFILCDIGCSTMNIYLYSYKKLFFSRCIKIPYSDFIKAMLMLDGFESPQQVLETANLSPDALALTPRISQAAGMFLSIVSEEIQRMTQFALSRKLKKPVEIVYLCGGVSTIKGITDYLRSALDLEVYTIESLSNVMLPENICLAEYINAIAAIAE